MRKDNWIFEAQMRAQIIRRELKEKRLSLELPNRPYKEKGKEHK